VRCVIDSGALTALIGRSADAALRLTWVLLHSGDIRIPSAVLVECTTGDGARDAEVNRILGILEAAGAVLDTADEPTARRAGRLRFRARTDDGIDALVAACAAGDGSPAVVLTSDPDDLERLLAREPNVEVRVV
jgi:hypothetical protein